MDALNARDNPFATRRVERCLVFDPALVGTRWSDLLERWDQLGGRACVVGPHGAGKSTFLDAFVDRLDAPVVRFFFNRDKRCLSDDDLQKMEGGRGRIWIADGDTHLGFSERRRFHRASREAAGFLSARHRTRALPVLLRLKPDLALARVLLHRAHPEGARSLEPLVVEAFRRRRGNLRHLWLDCYDHLAGRR